MSGALLKREATQTDAHGQKPCDNGDRDRHAAWSGAARIVNKVPETQKRQGRFQRQHGPADTLNLDI